MEPENQRNERKDERHQETRDSTTVQDSPSMGEKHGGHCGHSSSDQQEGGKQNTTNHHPVYKTTTQKHVLETDEGIQGLY